MIKFILFCAAVGAILAGCKKMTDQSALETVEYPEVYQDSSIIENYHGTTISDPFRWLEDDNSDETKAWVQKQNDVSFSYLESIPFRNDLKKRLETLWDYEKYSSPFKEAGNYYYFKNNGLQNQSVLYKIVDGKEDEVVIDPNKFSVDGTASLAGISFSGDGKYLAYQISEGGSDWSKAYVLDLATMQVQKDELQWIKFSGLSWYKDGFYYSRYPASSSEDELSGKNEFHSLYFHKLGQNQSEDELVFQDKEHALRNVYGQTTEDERFLIIAQSESTSGNSVQVKDMTNQKAGLVTLVNDFKSDYRLIDNDGSKILFLTNIEASNQKIVVFEQAKDSYKSYTLIEEAEDVIQSVAVIGGKIYVEYLHNAQSLVKIFDLTGRYLQDLNLPGIGSLISISGKKEDNEAFFSFSSYTTPSTIYSLNCETQEYKIFKEPKIKFDLANYTTEQVWYTSYDGTKVPMFIIHHKNLKKNGNNPTMLYGYGGFDISLTPSFNVSILPLLENGGIYAVANLRGGGEFGKEWHLSGTKERKQNVFDDFHSAAEFLIKEKYTSSEKLAIRGGSNGGLLVGACMTQRPDLYKVAFPAVGVLDMLRYHKFTIGWAWVSDYGSSDNPEDFKHLIKYSPLHNIKKTAYPATMITTADHDDRVVPAHSFKFASELQSKQQGSNPVLIRIETSAGHGAGKPTSKIIEEQADILSFMFYNMNENLKFEVKG